MFAVFCLLVMVSLGSAQGKALPSAIDLRPDFARLGLDAQAQGKRDTCSLFAIATLADFQWAKDRGRGGQPLSVEFLAWAANEATGLTGDQAMFYEAVHGLNELGICTAALMPYEKTHDARRAPSAAARGDAKERRGRWRVTWIKRWDVSRGLSADELGAVKRALASGHPVACGLRWPLAPSGGSLLKVPPAGKVRDGHSIVFTGYKDASAGGDGILRFRNSAGPGWGDGGYGVMSYSYACAYANDALWLQLGAAGSEIPTERVEAEAMTVLSREKCEATPQNMAAWGKGMWSEGKQLFCRARRGGCVELSFEVRQAGRYRVRVVATAAPDYGIIRVVLDGRAQRPEFDLYAGRVCPAGALELGDHELAGGKHTLRFTAVGKHARSSNYFFGLDRVELLPPPSPQPVGVIAR
jgi:hypothetical protein